MIVVGTDIGGDGGAEDAEAVGVGAGDDLLIGREDSLDEGGCVLRAGLPFRA